MTDPTPDIAPPRTPWSPWVLKTAVALLSCGTVGLGLLVRPDLVLVEHVRFEGASRSTETALRHLVDVRNGATMWRVDLEAVEAGAERHPWVRDARARREWPNTVVVAVDEYVPVALLEQDGLHYIDADGTVFLTARADDLDYPVITGIDAELGRLHPDLPRLALRDALGLLAALDQRGLVPRERVSEIHFSATSGFTVQVTGGARLVFSLEDRERQLERLAALVGRGVDPGAPILVDLAPASLAIVRPLDAVAGEG